MKYLYPHLDRQTLLNMIVAAAELYHKQEIKTVSTEILRADLVSMSYAFLSKHNLYTDDVPLFKSFLTQSDIRLLKDFHIYNYNKLKLHST